MPNSYKELEDLQNTDELIDYKTANKLEINLNKFVDTQKIELHKENCADITVIVPVYNSEMYIEQCIRQVNSSKYKVELIVVDDGQTDKSLEIIQRLQDKNELNIFKFIVLSQKNSGAQCARNKALDIQTGTYIMLLDSDDYLTPGTIDKMLDIAYSENDDIVQMNYSLLYEQNIKDSGIDMRDIVVTRQKEMFKCPGYGCMKLYKRDLFSNVRFPVGFWYEDTIVHLVLFAKCKKLRCTSYVGYVYRQNEKSITLQMKGNRKCLDACKVMNPVIQIMLMNNIKFTDDILDEIKVTLQSVLVKRLRWMKDKEMRCVYLYCKPYLKGMQYHEWKGSDL